MKQILSLICLFVLTLGVAQAYSPPEEFNDQELIVFATDADQLDVVAIAPEDFHKASMAEFTYLFEAESSNSEDALWAVVPVGTVPDVGKIDLYNSIGLRPNNFQGLLKDHSRHRDYLLNSGRELVPAVPWRSLSKWSTDHRHYIRS